MTKPKVKSKAALKREAVQHDTGEAEAKITKGVAELHRLQRERLVVEQALAAHTGLFGWGVFVMSDPENDALLAEIKDHIVQVEQSLAGSRKILEALTPLTKRKP